MFINSAMFLWQLFLVRLHLAQFLFLLSEQVNGHVPACPIFLLAHPANGRNARLGQCMVYHPAVHEVFGAEAVMVDDFPHAAVNEHIAYDGSRRVFRQTWWSRSCRQNCVNRLRISVCRYSWFRCFEGSTLSWRH